MAETITINVPHRLTSSEAREKLDKGFGKLQEQIAGKPVAVEQTWEKDGDRDAMRFRAGIMGQSITGRLVILEKEVMITIDLPWLLAKISGTVKDKLLKGTRLLLDKK